MCIPYFVRCQTQRQISSIQRFKSFSCIGLSISGAFLTLVSSNDSLSDSTTALQLRPLLTLFPAEKNFFKRPAYTGLNSLRFCAHTGFKIPFATSSHWILFTTATWLKRGQHAAFNNFFIIQDKKTVKAKCSGIKDLQEYINIFFIPIGVLKILIL